MRSIIALAFLVTCVAFVSPAQIAHESAHAPKGHLLVVGGGGTTDAIVAKAFELAGGMEARMLIVPQASESADAGEESAKFWREKGGHDVRVLDLADVEKARAAIREAAFVWMPGGDQVRLMEALTKAGVVDAIRERFQSGALVGGTSAGAAVISQVMIMGGDKADATLIRAGATQTASGIGLWTDAIVDQHFVKRDRLNRLLSCALDHPALVGVGIDERTGVVVSGSGACEVVGDSTVVVIDARTAKRAEVKTGDLFAATGVTLDIYRLGEHFDLATSARRQR